MNAPRRLCVPPRADAEALTLLHLPTPTADVDRVLALLDSSATVAVRPRARVKSGPTRIQRRPAPERAPRVPPAVPVWRRRLP